MTAHATQGLRAPSPAAPRAARSLRALQAARPAAAAPRQRYFAVKAAGAEGGKPAMAAAAGIQKRGLVLGAASAALALQLGLPAAMAEDAAADLKVFKDTDDVFEITLPASWEMGVGAIAGTGLADRKVLAFYPPGNPANNISIVVTNVAADFTRMGSFGDAYTFGFNLVGSLDRSEINKAPKWMKTKERPPGQEAILEDAKEKGGMYYIDYTIATDYSMESRAYEDKKRFFSAVAIGNNGIYNRLYTVTATFDEAESATYKKVMQAAINSFKPPPNKALSG